jgi:hypothetical protein
MTMQLNIPDKVLRVKASLLRKSFVHQLISLVLVVVAPLVLAADPAKDYVYKVVKGDTVIGLSSRLLKSPADWPLIVRHNRLRNPHYIVPGEDLLVPLALLNSALTGVTVTHVQGDVKAAASPGAASSVLALGASLAEGAQVVTGKDGYATLKLQDGSTVRVQSGTEVQVERQRSYTDVGIFESVIKLAAGRVESLVQKLLPEAAKKQSRHEIKTPQANLAVRGTEFRVTMDTQSNTTRGEVLEGVVAMAAEGIDASTKRLDAGFGGVIGAGQKSVSDPVALLGAPDVTQLAKLQERTILRFPLPAISGASSYRAQVARDDAFNLVVAEIVSASPELRVADIADGNYFLRARAMDGRGLEGRNATHAFTLKARPEPPLVSAPPAKGKVRATDVEFKWAENTEAATYRLQVAKDAAFKTVVHDNKAVQGVQSVVGKLGVGDYFWRVASLRKDGDHGPFGDASAFTLLAPPAVPEPPKIGDSGINFRWPGEPGQTFEFQMAGNAKFDKPIVAYTLASPEIDLPLPREGTYFMRFRAIDADGFVGPFIPAQRFVVPLPPWPSPYPVPSLPLYDTTP